jgi:hypothetical protein
VGADLAHEVICIAGLADDLKARLLEQAHEPLPQEQRVLGDY